MNIFNWIKTVGSYVLLMKRVLTKPDKWSMFWKQLMTETNNLVIDSIGIVCLISVFIGVVCCIQIQMNISSPLLPKFTLGATTREILVLEFSSAVMALILAGKVGSNIASEIGTMRITEQIDALEVMGVNSANYLILPKVIAMVVFMPILVIFSIACGLAGGALICYLTSNPSIDIYVFGIQALFKASNIYYAIKKSYFFAFLITTIPAYCGYTVKGGALQVGRKSTQAVVVSSVMVLLCDVILTNLLLT
ncbi:MAG: ABC transporter permease [Bacteroidales bacterium]|nr:ABC transporter permease [Bacteroidales bacterium]